jgi:DNA-binding SARP family transcriptional activator
LRQARLLRERCLAQQEQVERSLEELARQARELSDELAAVDDLIDSLTTLQSIAVLPAEPALDSEPALARPALREARLAARCLGGFELRLDGVPQDLGRSRKGRLALEYLLVAARGHRVGKEALAELLWPEARHGQALVSLHAAVYQLRRATAASQPALLEEPLIVYADDQYRLNPSYSLESDLDAVRAALAAARRHDAQGEIDLARSAYRRAVELAVGPLLPDEPYEDWAIEEREALQADLLVAYDRLLGLALADADYAELLGLASRALRLDPGHEAAHRALMLGLARVGRRIEALRAWRRCQRQLREELGVEPEPETRALGARLQRGEPV